MLPEFSFFSFETFSIQQIDKSDFKTLQPIFINGIQIQHIRHNVRNAVSRVESIGRCMQWMSIEYVIILMLFVVHPDHPDHQRTPYGLPFE